MPQMVVPSQSNQILSTPLNQFVSQIKVCAFALYSICLVLIDHSYRNEMALQTASINTLVSAPYPLSLGWFLTCVG